MKISAVQYPIEAKVSFDRFLEKNLFYFNQAKENNSRLCLFPELIALDLIDFTQDLESQWQDLQRKNLFQQYLDFLKEKSSATGIIILGGSFPVTESGQIHNVCALVFPNGDVILQKKIFLTPGELEWNWTHSSQLHRFELDGLQTCILICHDSEFPLISEFLAKQNLDLLLVPSMTEDHAGLERVRFCSQARAIEHHCYAIVTGTVGTQEKPYTAQACVLTPRNSLFAHLEPQIGKYNEVQVVHFEIDIPLLRKSKAQQDFIFPCRDQRERKLNLL